MEDIPLKSHIHFGMFALKKKLLGNSKGTEQSNNKESLGMFCKIIQLSRPGGKNIPIKIWTVYLKHLNSEGLNINNPLSVCIYDSEKTLNTLKPPSPPKQRETQQAGLVVYQ